MSSARIEELRKNVMTALEDDYAHGRLGERDFEEKLEKALMAEDSFALKALYPDLPAVSPSPTPSSSRAVEYDREQSESHEPMVSIMGGVTRKGRWHPARTISNLTVMGGTELDFRDAVFPGNTVYINTLCIMGGVDILVSPGTRIVCKALPIMGGVDNKAYNRGDEAGSNGLTLVIKGLIIMGGLDIKVK